MSDTTTPVKVTTNSSGFNLPTPPDEPPPQSDQPPQIENSQTTTTLKPQTSASGTAHTEKTIIWQWNFESYGRHYAIGLAVLLVLMIIFIFAQKKYSNWLVRKRHDPRSASAAGFWLFLLLTALAAIAIFPLVRNDIFLNLPFMCSVGAVALISFILLVAKSRQQVNAT